MATRALLYKITQNYCNNLKIAEPRESGSKKKEARKRYKMQKDDGSTKKSVIKQDGQTISKSEPQAIVEKKSPTTPKSLAKKTPSKKSKSTPPSPGNAQSRNSPARKQSSKGVKSAPSKRISQSRKPPAKKPKTETSNSQNSVKKS